MNLGATAHVDEFDTTLLDKNLEDATVEILRGLGTRIVTGVVSRLRYRPGSSSPGQPPHVHRGKRGSSPLAQIAFAQPDPLNMIAGPLADRETRIPRTIEEGGESIARDGSRITIAPRPFMRPTFELETMQAPSLWADCISP